MSRWFAGTAMAHAPAVREHARSPLRNAGLMLWRQRWAIGLCIAVAAGTVFRLIWASDMEYKDDEPWTFGQVQEFWRTGKLELIGMPSSALLPNAGMSVWVFIALSSLLPRIDPVGLVRAVELVNVAA